MEVAADHRRRGADGIVGQIKALWPIIMACCVTYAAWDGLRTKTAENSTDIVAIKSDVEILKQTMAAQTAILSRVEISLQSIDRGIRHRASDADPLP